MNTIPHFLRLTDLAQTSGVNVGTLERYIYKSVLFPDATIEHGRSQSPIFLKSRLGEHIKTIRKYRESLMVEAK
jgi:hypothetical protein